MSISMLRASIFLFFFICLSIIEYLRPWARVEYWGKRKVNNLCLHIMNALIIRLLLVGSVGRFAGLEITSHIGLFRKLHLPIWQQMILSLLILELTVYLQHFFSHRIGWLWKLHRVHHSDLVVDTTTALRFHPLEIIFSILCKGFVVVIFGMSLRDVVVFEIILNSMAMFSHSNIVLSDRLSRFLGIMFVLPEWHRIHHSVRSEEMNSNFGFNLIIWDKLFGTFKKKNSNSKFGLNNFHFCEEFLSLVFQPFRK